MSFNFNAGINLPFAYNQLMSQPLQFRIDSPPCIPNVGCDQRLQYLLPAVCSLVANEASIKSGSHAGRVFQFNQISANNYNNQDFATAVATSMDILLLNLTKNVARNAEEGLQGAVNDAMLLLCSLNFQTYPSLQNVTPPDIVNDALGNIGTLIRIGNEVNVIKGGGRQPQQVGYGQPQQNTQVAWGTNQQAYGNQQYNQSPNNYDSRYGAQQPMGNTGLFSGGNNQVNTNNNTRQVGAEALSGGKYDYLNKQPVQQQEVVMAQHVPSVYHLAQQNQLEPEPQVVVDVASDDLVWVPSELQPYPHTVDPTRQKLLKKKVKDNDKTCVVTYIVPMKDDEMALERSKHQLTTMDRTYTMHIPENADSRKGAIQDSVRELGKLTGSDIINSRKPDNLIEEEFAHELETHVRTSWEIDAFLDSAIFEGRLSHKRSNSNQDTECTAYRVYTTIATPLIGNKDYRDVIKKLSTSISFRDLANALKEYSVLETEDRGVLLLLSEINKLFTAEVNHVLRNRLCLPGVTIDDFTDDIMELNDYLLKKFGDIYQRAFISVQKELVSQILNTIDEKSANALSENLCTEEDSVVLNYLSRNYSITYLNVHTRELGFEPFESCASAILESGTPLLYRIAKGIFDQERDLDQKVLHRVLITADDKRFEINAGLIGNGVYTVCPFVN